MRRGQVRADARRFGLTNPRRWARRTGFWPNEPDVLRPPRHDLAERTRRLDRRTIVLGHMRQARAIGLPTSGVALASQMSAPFNCRDGGLMIWASRNVGFAMSFCLDSSFHLHHSLAAAVLISLTATPLDAPAHGRGRPASPNEMPRSYARGLA